MRANYNFPYFCYLIIYSIFYLFNRNKKSTTLCNKKQKLTEDLSNDEVEDDVIDEEQSVDTASE